MEKRMRIYILGAIVILVGSFLYCFPDFFPELYRKVKFMIIQPKNYKECVLAGGKETLANPTMDDGALGRPFITDSDSCEINGKEFGASPWSN